MVLGDGGVGKSALTLQYVQHNFIDYHDPTIEDAYQQRTVIGKRKKLYNILNFEWNSPKKLENRLLSRFDSIIMPDPGAILKVKYKYQCEVVEVMLNRIWL